MDEPNANLERPVPELDENLVRKILGKRVLAGITYRDRDSDEIIKLEQFHGVMVRVSSRDGVIVQLNDGTERWLPPVLSRLEEASPGNYRLKGTGEVVVDPDYLSTWTVYPKEVH